MKKYGYMIKTIEKDGSSHYDKKFKYPLKKNALVKVSDWNPKHECGGGIHGLIHETRKHFIQEGELWLVLKYIKKEAVVVDSEVIKVPRAWVIDWGTAEKMQRRFEKLTKKPYTYNYCIKAVGDNSILKAEDDSILKAGNGSTLKAGDINTLQVGDFSAIIAGHNSTLKAGFYSTLKAGDYSSLRAGNYSTLEAGYGSVLEAGDDSTEIVHGNIFYIILKGKNVLTRQINHDNKFFLIDHNELLKKYKKGTELRVENGKIKRVN